MKIVSGDTYLSEIKELIIEYTKFLNRDLSFQSLDTELNDLTQKYTGKEGCILVLLDDSKVVGCVAYHRLSDTCCEMKRLYVKPETRGRNAGEKLIEAIISEAKNHGYKEMVLDTIKPLEAAIHLYKKCGFQECDPYYHNPFPDVIYMTKTL